MTQKKELSVEQLLKPRIKTIAPWPHMAWVGESGFSLDEVFYPVEKHGRYYYNGVDVNKYPHLFRKLSWWEEREESEMPEYVKLVMNDKNQYVHKVESWKGENFDGVPVYEYFNKAGTPTIGCISDLDPATHKEYLSYTQTKDNETKN